MIQFKLAFPYSMTKYWLHKKNFGPVFPTLIMASICAITNSDTDLSFICASHLFKLLNINL